jgi:hypothetical protein
MRRAGRYAWLAVVAALALILPSMAFWLAVFPAPLRLFGDRITHVVFRILDLPTSALNAALPFDWRSALASQFAQGPMTYGWSILRRYLVVGFPAYLLLGAVLTFLVGRFLGDQNRSGLGGGGA